MAKFSVESIFKAVDKITAPVSRMQRNVLTFTRATERGLGGVNRAVSSVAKGLAKAGTVALKAGVAGFGALSAAVALAIREFSKIENAEAAFTPLLGSARRAREAVEAINLTAATTPFQFEDLASSVNQLLPVMDGNIERTIKTLRMLGDTAGGNAQKLDSITRGFTKAMLKGKVDMESLNMIAEAGVPIFQDLAEVMGMKTGVAFFKRISAGKVSTGDLIRAFEKLTTTGGKFFNGMEIASKTTTGLWSTLKDNISLTAAEIGGVLAPFVKDLITRLTGGAQRLREWVKLNRELIAIKVSEFINKITELAKKFYEYVKRLNGQYSVFDRLIDVVTGLGSAFAFLAKHGETIAKLIGYTLALTAALKTFSAVMAIVNVVMLANPVGLIVLGIAALIAAVAAAIVWWDELKAAFRSLPTPVKGAVKAITAPVRWLISAGKALYDNWGSIAEFFADLWSGVVGIFNSGLDSIMRVVDRVKKAALDVVGVVSNVSSVLGFGDDETSAAKSAAKKRTIISPQDRLARQIEERRTTSTAEVTIRDDTGRAEVTRGSLGAGIQLKSSGAF